MLDQILSSALTDSFHFNTGGICETSKYINITSQQTYKIKTTDVYYQSQMSFSALVTNMSLTHTYYPTFGLFRSGHIICTKMLD